MRCSGGRGWGGIIVFFVGRFHSHLVFHAGTIELFNVEGIGIEILTPRGKTGRSYEFKFLRPQAAWGTTGAESGRQEMFDVCESSTGKRTQKKDRATD